MLGASCRQLLLPLLLLLRFSCRQLLLLVPTAASACRPSCAASSAGPGAPCSSSKQPAQHNNSRTVCLLVASPL